MRKVSGKYTGVTEAMECVALVAHVDDAVVVVGVGALESGSGTIRVDVSAGQ